ncbi:unnamed protein product [Urochloa humidicola]
MWHGPLVPTPNRLMFARREGGASLTRSPAQPPPFTPAAAGGDEEDRDRARLRRRSRPPPPVWTRRAETAPTAPGSREQGRGAPRSPAGQGRSRRRRCPAPRTVGGVRAVLLPHSGGAIAAASPPPAAST